MKIQCDVCEKEAATVFCSADEAALCNGCDRRVHHANKLAEKHLRFSLLHPSFKDFPRCDVCQERLAFLFCREDRAILCRECDVPIHNSNEHTKKHNRFLLTGVKLSASSSLYPTSLASSNCSNISIDTEIKRSELSKKNPVSVSNEVVNQPEKTLSSTTYKIHHDHQISDNSSISMSSISEYLIETLPGWRVDDFLDPSPSTASHGICKFMDHDVESTRGSFPFEDLAGWVPQIPPSSSHLPMDLPHTGLLNGYKVSKGGNNKKVSREQRDDCFIVPQIRPPSFKKSRHLW